LNTTPRTHWLWTFWFHAVLTACESTTQPSPGTPDAGLTLDVIPADAVPTPFPLCELALQANRPAALCTTSRDCAPNELCVGSADGTAVCAALCFPDDCPVDSCGEGADCALLQIDVGQPLVADVNGDGTEENVGACLLLPDATAPTWGPCNDTRTCIAPDVCIQLPGRDSGICTPPCGAYCLPTGGFQTTCVGTSGGGSVCVIPCDPALGVGQCPPENACVTAGTGFAVCTW
jgi:hypothetical protein